MPDSTLMSLPGWHKQRTAGGALADCSLVVATYKRPLDVMALLGAIHELQEQPAEIVIVDGFPADELSGKVREWAEANVLAFDLIYVESAPGLTLQRNIGIDLTSGKFVFFLDDDAIPLPGYFSAMRTVLLNDSRCLIGGIGGCVMNEIDRPISRRWQLRFALRLVPRLEPMIYYRSCTHTPRGLMKPFSGVREVDVLPGCTWTFRREVLETIRFSEFFRGYSQGEDLEMSLRVGRQWKLVCCGNARIIHKASPGGRPKFFERGKMDVINRYFIWKRHTPDAEPRYVTLFWLDILFLHAMDLAWFCARPWRFGSLSHAVGLFVGSLRCIFDQPRFSEPAPRRRFALMQNVQEVQQ
jgi:GT2 family glycosyltransferase